MYAGEGEHVCKQATGASMGASEHIRICERAIGASPGQRCGPSPVPPRPQAAGESPGGVPPLTLPRSAGTLRVELLNQSSLDLLRYDDGPYEAGGEKDQDPSLIPVPANSYLGTGRGMAEPGHGTGAPHTGPPRPHHPAPAPPPAVLPPLTSPSLFLSRPGLRHRAGVCDKH